MGFLLFTELFVPMSGSRMAELLRCIQLNTQNPLIDKIYLFYERETPPGIFQQEVLQHEKLYLMENVSRVRFDDFFQILKLAPYQDRNIIIANTDIWIPEFSLKLVEERFDLSQHILALSRWDYDPAKGWKLFQRRDSQDAWIFRNPVVDVDAPFFLGKPGCDNRLTYELSKTGRRVSNPCLDIQINHEHRSKVRTWTRNPAEVVPGPRMNLKQVTIEEALSIGYRTPRTRFT